MKYQFEFYKEVALKITNEKVFETTCSRISTAKQRFDKVHDGSFPVVMIQKIGNTIKHKESMYFGLLRIQPEDVISFKKYKRFYMVQTQDSVQYIRLQSTLIFGPEEGVEILKKSHPDAKEIKYLPPKTAKFLGLK